jgi:hypothetical protein
MARLRQKRNWIYFLAGLLIFFVSRIIFHHAQINVYDGFEHSTLSENWSAERMVPSAFEIQSKVVRSGKMAAKITLRTGDKVEEKTDKDKASERDELAETISLFAIEGEKYEYQFSMFLPESFPIVPVRLVIAQWKQYCPICACSENSPILAIRYISGNLIITLQTSSVRDTLYISSDEFRNRWLDFKFQIRFSKLKDGEVKAFLNEKQIINYQGVTSYPDNCLVLSDKNKYYFKMGLYRDTMSETMTIYIDEYRKNQLKEISN